MPSRIVIDHGRERLRALTASRQALLRWYAGCCGAPLANCLANPRLPFAGVLTARSADAERVIGPTRFVAFAGSATGPVDRRGGGGIIGLFAATPPRGFGAALRGDRASPFFEAGRPVSTPRPLSDAERAAAYGDGAHAR